MKKIFNEKAQVEFLLSILKSRFELNMHRHADIDWKDVFTKLDSSSAQLWSLNEMERTGGEPDVIEFDAKTQQYTFYDCSVESPAGRRGLCYDQLALDSRKSFKPKNSAISMAAEMGVELLSEEQYRKLQQIGEFDTKTSSWLHTPNEIRSLGGAIFADRRYNHVFVFHNGAESYYASRGFRGMLKV